jgi:LacI family transcriptional regulator, galactose operon repressor
MREPQRKPRRRHRGVATIKDVARRAGVSPMTVSRVVNGSEYVSDATRRTVLRAVKDLGYSPNLAARSLASERGERLGLLYGNPSTAYLSEFLVGALDAASRHGVQLVLEKCEPTPVASRRAVRRLLAGGVVGVVLPPPLCESAAMRAELLAARLPLVTVAAGRPDTDTMCVRIDDYSAAREMTRYLLGLGHERLAFIKGHPNQSASEERWRGFSAALTEAAGARRGEPPAPMMEQGFFSFRSGLDAARKLLAAEPGPTAIFASNDDMAAAVVAEAHRRGLDVPRDLTVVGFDDTLIASTIWPELTTIQQPIARMAAEAIDMLVAAVRGASQAQPLQRLIPHALIARQSAAAPQSAGRHLTGRRR